MSPLKLRKKAGKKKKNTKYTNVALEKQRALGIRNGAMESVKETQKRNCQDEPKEQNSRKSSNHTLFF